MKSLPGSQPLLGEIPPKLVAGILGRSYDATPCSPHFLSAPALPYSSSFCSLVLLTISFFFFCLFSLPPPFLPPLRWLRGGAAALVGSQWRLAVADEDDSVEGLFHQHCSSPPVPPTLLPLLLFFLCCPVPPPFSPLFLFFSAVHPLAFIARGWKRFPFDVSLESKLW